MTIRQLATSGTLDLVDRVAAHLCRTLPPAPRGGREAETVRAAVARLVTSPREDLLVLPIEDDHGLASVALLKERTSVLTDEPEGFVYCLVPCRPAPSIAPATIEQLERLMRDRRWSTLRLSLLAADAPTLAPLIDATRLRPGWIVARKDLGGDHREARSLPGATRAARPDDMDFIVAGWRDAFAAGLQEEGSWRSRRSPAEAADLELARLLDSEHCVLLVIESRGAPIGFVAAEVGLADSLTARRECHVHDCYVLPDYRGRGYSQRGTDRMEQIARDAGCDYMTGTVTGPSAEAMERILGHIGRQGWIPHQVIHRCRAPLRPRSAPRSAPRPAMGGSASALR
jgi:GNAT superfamily N-acetyltransferase